ncbi:NH(3)-dependent NAD(+) synthetase [Mesocricetibacter intestinalis]|uniref:NH(3)-dependent NAD(+) synthetase n=1 Tax=Mesocricetibacter intestinalis TaxID=1521930 RepID=A0A4R6V7B8_9PAST|nr:NAD(+) synthase [Mesocricetibacter intestinalis]TDQ57367.1 NH(3)-dependent NAD(+) synthetase [Mesocricetibacter intestinalis]
MQNYIDYLVDWLEQQRREYAAEGYVLGISGGIDSALAAHLLVRTSAPVQGLILPSPTTSAQDIADARAVAQSAGCPVMELSISALYEGFMQSMAALFNQEAERQNVIAGNVQARLRMTALYAYAQSHRAIVVGTDNAAEWLTGYFTKFGDGGVDVAPLLGLRKEQVYQLAKLLGVPAQIMEKAPSAGLWQGQTDETEMGVSYAEIDAFLRGERVSAEAQRQIDFWHNRSHHKRRLAPAPLSLSAFEQRAKANNEIKAE